jgi:transposase-like protein
VDRGTEQRYVVPAKSADESTIRLLLADRQQEPLTVYTDGFRAYDPLDEDEQFDREYVVHGDGEYVDETIQVNTCESHALLARRWLSTHRRISKDLLTQCLRAFQLKRELHHKPGLKALKHAAKATL